MEVINTQVYGLESSIMKSGMPMRLGRPVNIMYGDCSTDIERAEKLANVPSGSGHDNFMKGIIVQADIKYPQYFTPQLQRYNFVDIVSSQSKMHKLTSCNDIEEHCNKYVLPSMINDINKMIGIYNESLYPCQLFKTSDYTITANNEKELFHYIISNLPMGYELWMGISTNYLQLKTIYKQRRSHKLTDWRKFCIWIESLPNSELITGKIK